MILMYKIFIFLNSKYLLFSGNNIVFIPDEADCDWRMVAIAIELISDSGVHILTLFKKNYIKSYTKIQCFSSIFLFLNRWKFLQSFPLLTVDDKWLSEFLCINYLLESFEKSSNPKVIWLASNFLNTLTNILLVEFENYFIKIVPKKSWTKTDIILPSQLPSHDWKRKDLLCRGNQKPNLKALHCSLLSSFRFVYILSILYRRHMRRKSLIPINQKDISLSFLRDWAFWVWILGNNYRHYTQMCTAIELEILHLMESNNIHTSAIRKKS